MLKYIIFILIFNVLCFAQDFDIYEISDRKSVAKINIKRQLGPQNQHPILKDSPENTVEHKQKNTDSVKKALPPKEINSAAVEQTKNEDDNQSKNKSPTKINEETNEASKSISTNENKTNIETVSVLPAEPAKNDSSSLKNPKYATTEHPGAALRGFYVFLGLSVLIIIYFIFKAFRLRPGAPPPTTVRKYGIVGRRSDMEMLPLPLAEEEDDDTLFDMGTQMNR